MAVLTKGLSPRTVASLAGRLHELGCEEIALGDTIGAGTPLAACRVVGAAAHWVRLGRIAVHFMTPRGQALANIRAFLGLGVSIIDAAVAPVRGERQRRDRRRGLLGGMGIETGSI